VKARATHIAYRGTFYRTLCGLETGRVLGVTVGAHCVEPSKATCLTCQKAHRARRFA
jgi:hypothetical protein